MRYEITFGKNDSFAIISTSGELSVKGHQLFLKDLIAHPKWKPGMDVLVDHRAASLDTVTLYDIHMVSLMVKQLKDNLGSGGLCAIVLSNDAEFTKVAMWKVMTSPEVDFKIEFFDSLEDAKNWLL